jgi:hypothetical protein
MKRLFKRKRLRCYPRHTIRESLRSLSVYEQAVPPEINLRGMIGGNYRALSFRAIGSYLGVSSASFTVEALSGDGYYERERNSPYSLANHVTIDRYLKANEPIDYEESEE